MVADVGRPEPHLLDPVPLPDAQPVVLEAREQVRQPAREGGVDAEFVDHACDGGSEWVGKGVWRSKRMGELVGKGV